MAAASGSAQADGAPGGSAPSEVLRMWTECPRQGKLLRGFVAHKLPLDELSSDALGVDEADRFTPTMLIERQLHAKQPIGLAISLLIELPRVPAGPPPAPREAEWDDWDVAYACVPCAAPLPLGARGAGALAYSEQLPPPQLVAQFVERCVAFWRVEKPDAADAAEPAGSTNHLRAIGVHCNTGFNLSGYLICHFLVMTLHVPAAAALGAFAASRPPGIYDRSFIEALFRFHRQAVPSPDSARPSDWAPPQTWPAWHSRLREQQSAATLTAAAAAVAAGGAAGKRPAAAVAVASGGGGGGGASGGGAQAPSASAAAGAADGAGSGAAARKRPAPPPVPAFAQPAPPAAAASGGGGAGAGAGAKRPRDGGGDSAVAAAAPLPTLGGLGAHAAARPRPAGSGAPLRPFGTAVHGGTRARARRICCQLLGLRPPAEGAAGAEGGAAPGAADSALVPLLDARAPELSARALHGALREGGDARWLVSWEPHSAACRAAPQAAGCAAAPAAAAPAAAAAPGAAAGAPSGLPPALPCALLWLEGRAFALLSAPVRPAAAAAPPGADGAAAPPPRADTFVLPGLQLPGTPDRSLLGGTLVQPRAPGASASPRHAPPARWRLYLRELLALGGKGCAHEPLERRLALLAKHALAPRASLAREQTLGEPVALYAHDHFRLRRATFALDEVAPALRALHGVGGLRFVRKDAPHPCARAAGAEAEGEAEAAWHVWSEGAEGALPEAELRACEWLRLPPPA